jgi:hypothetical protein
MFCIGYCKICLTHVCVFLTKTFALICFSIHSSSVDLMHFGLIYLIRPSRAILTRLQVSEDEIMLTKLFVLSA